MNDDFATEPPSLRQKPERRRGRIVVSALLVVLLLVGAAALWAAAEAGWLNWRGWQTPPATEAPPAPLAPRTPQPVLVPADHQAQAALGVRLAEMEQRLSRLDRQTDVVAENAARAEGLMIAFAVRRAIERGLPLGYLAGQLKLRFGDAQPNAVATLIEASGHPVTREQLINTLDRLAPALTGPPPGQGPLSRIEHELSNLFVIRKASAPSPQPERRLERARQLLEMGRVDAALKEVQGLPGREAAAPWLELARRHIMTERALDLIETAALLEPRQRPTRAPALAPSTPAPNAAPAANEQAAQTG